MPRLDLKSLLIFIICLGSISIVHFANRNALSIHSPQSLQDGMSVRTADDASYLRPVENFLAGSGWQSNAAGTASFLTRTPGYGLFYLLFRSFLGERSAIMALLIFQVLLFAWALVLLPQLVMQLGVRAKIAWSLGFLCALLPSFSGFISYTLTEAVTPSLVIIFLFFLFGRQRLEAKAIWPASFVLAVLILIRPPMLIWVLSFPVLFFLHHPAYTLKRVLGAVFIAVLPLLAWQVWASAKAGEVVGLHPIYRSDANTLYRPVHKSIWQFHKAFGQSGEDFHRGIGALWDAALDGQEPDPEVAAIIGLADENAVDLIGREKLTMAYLDYYRILALQAPFFEKGVAMPGNTQNESSLAKKFNTFRSTYIRAFPFQSWVVVPLRVYGDLAFHSNLSLYVFQRHWRGNLLVEALRYISFGLHSGLFLLFPVCFFLCFRQKKILAIAVPVALYLLYLCTVQRGVEERYTVPVLIPMMLVVVGVTVPKKTPK